MDKETSDAIERLGRVAGALVGAARRMKPGESGSIHVSRPEFSADHDMSGAVTIDGDLVPGLYRICAAGAFVEISATRRGAAFSVTFDRARYTVSPDPDLYLIHDVIKSLEQVLETSK